MSIPSFLNILPISYTLSYPPTINLFKFNSVAILKYIGKSNALWCVINGLAVAPPDIVFNIGVSTSKYPFSSNILLISVIILLLVSKVFFTSGFIIKSTYLCLYLKSGSFNPWNFSGNGLNDFESNVTSFACTEISSVLVLNTKPVIPIISPMSYVLNAL